MSCLVIPDGCLGLPILAALKQEITVISVIENRNLMENDLASLPWKSGRFIRVQNYWEAIGAISCLRAGIDPLSVRRPLGSTPVSVKISPAQSNEESTCQYESNATSRVGLS